MKTMPAIGTRVRYIPEQDSHRKTQCTGIVVAQYPGYGEVNTDPETGEKWISPDGVAILVDKPLPIWWAYPDTDRFAPDIDQLEIIK